MRDGLGTVVAHAADGLDVRLGATVTNIDWSAASSVRVESTAGTLSARAAIVTVPTSACFARGGISFNSAPPAVRRDALNSYRSASNKVFFALAPGSFDAGDARHFIGRATARAPAATRCFPRGNRCSARSSWW
ncbi:MAG: FAD-dependent oxidoreductase [Proteobacteria bacterium]|nr:FAD-dependent oxidoreductase [Pseudomonadota bacterium]